VPPPLAPGNASGRPCVPPPAAGSTSFLVLRNDRSRPAVIHNARALPQNHACRNNQVLQSRIGYLLTRRLQPRQFLADAGDAGADQGLVTDESEGKAIRIGAKVVSHGRYVIFQMAEVAIPRQMFQEILRLIAELRPQPPPALA
jgi:hypothetical protein